MLQKMSTKIMHKRSLKCQEANKLVAIYTSREGDDFEAGYIEVVTANNVIFAQGVQTGTK
ncbi:hypothetical protein [Listeria monocytogenes]|uniref:hypothetical protein n=3 Tax=Listeria monocytogenes TaxID=1639 RepID=UPI00159F68CE|nr:hypothetical protein [Listeria monocytogenes]EFN3771610.1 hypothetical protein [Listeria monocytogenes]EHT4846693.1 hypothetical protein [Listeria monocytogenes]EHW1518443.1 hypothetical protein [Listeria monocytogenes]EIB2236221.1 hypothetical protein [Listeria monocytogenes]EIZ2729565.1 hypothetical protein [Listeria monocytogenes]